jgi:ABC-type multidrug transport system fused ATPase/permease subunit
MSIINIMSFPLFVFPVLLSSVTSSRVATRRLTNYMKLPERDVSAITPVAPDSQYALEINDAVIGWNASRPILSGVNLKLKRGTLTAIVGPVGCGKSTLLGALLGDASCLQGNVHAPRTLAYVPQQAWIQNARVRENVLFGRKMDRAKYQKALAACALDKDLEKFSDGEETEIGERGVNLSGGQKQRVSIARAVYMDSDVYLLDDPISALDSHVARHVFEECVCGALAGKTRVLVTHKLDVLPAADLIVVLGNGTVQACGTYEQLRAQGVDLGAIVHEIEEQEKEKEMAMASAGVDAGADGGDCTREQERDGSSGSGSTKAAHDDDEPRQNADQDESAGAEEQRAAAGKQESHATADSQDDATATATHNKAATKKKVTFKEPETRGDATAAAMPKRSPSQFGQITAEARQQGALSREVYMYYLQELKLPALAACICLGILSQAARNGNDWWLTRWASAKDKDNVRFYLGIYAAWNVLSSLLFWARDVSLNIVELRAASRMHNSMFASVMRAPMHFFDTTPIGRILNRFSNDQDALDGTLPRTLNVFFTCILRVVGTVSVVTAVSPTFLISMLPITWLYWTAKELYSATSRELKRIESTTKSPLYSHFGETVAGASCIRASGQEERFAVENCARVDRMNNLFNLINHCNRWLAIRLELCGNGIVTCAALTGVISRRCGWVSEQGASLVGLSLTLALAVTGALGWMVRMSTDAEAQMNSVERVAEYVGLQVGRGHGLYLLEVFFLGWCERNSACKCMFLHVHALSGMYIHIHIHIRIHIHIHIHTQSEEEWLSRRHVSKTEEVPHHIAHTDESPHVAAKPLPEGWPNSGAIIFEDYTMSYRPGLPVVLNGVNLKVNSGEKVSVQDMAPLWNGLFKLSMCMYVCNTLEFGSANFISGIRVKIHLRCQHRQTDTYTDRQTDRHCPSCGHMSDTLAHVQHELHVCTCVHLCTSAHVRTYVPRM